MRNYFSQKIKKHSIYEAFRRLGVVFKLANERSKKFIIVSQILIAIRLLSGWINIGGAASILVLMNKPQIIHDNRYISAVYNYFEFTNSDYFLIGLMGLVLFLFVFQSMINVIVDAISPYVRVQIMKSFVTKLFSYYLNKKYEERVTSNLDDFLVKAGDQLLQVIDATLSISGHIISTIINVLIVAVVLAAVNIYLLISISMLLLFFYIVLMNKTRYRLKKYGEVLYETDVKKAKALRLGASGITDIILMDKEKQFFSQVTRAMQKMAIISLKKQLIYNVPAQTILGLGLAIGFILTTYSILTAGISFSMMIIVFIIILKLFPIANNLYTAMARVPETAYIYKIVIEDLLKANEVNISESMEYNHDDTNEYISIRDGITFEAVCYSYTREDEKKFFFNDINFFIPRGKTVALCGRSGSGKTTIARMISCLIEPHEGKVLLDGKSLWEDRQLLRKWQRSIGYVEQKPFLFNSSLAANVAFEIEADKIDYDKVEKMLRFVHLGELIEELSEGLNTSIGEGANILSGGQAQRVAIARALYWDAPFLIMDEATSALDAITANNILNMVKKQKGKTVLLIAHNIETLRDAHEILVVDNGSIIASGKYEELFETSDAFRQLLHTLQKGEYVAA